MRYIANVQNSTDVEIFIKVKEGAKIENDELEILAEIAADTYERDALETVKERVYEGYEDKELIKAVNNVEMIIADWPNMPDQSGYTTKEIREFNGKADFYQSQYNEEFNN